LLHHIYSAQVGWTSLIALQQGSSPPCLANPAIREQSPTHARHGLL